VRLINNNDIYYYNIICINNTIEVNNQGQVKKIAQSTKSVTKKKSPRTTSSSSGLQLSHNANSFYLGVKAAQLCDGELFFI